MDLQSVSQSSNQVRKRSEKVSPLSFRTIGEHVRKIIINTSVAEDNTHISEMDIKVNRKDGGVAPPINLGGLFATSDDSGDEFEDESQFNNKGESQTLTVGSKQLLIRQFAWHQANANQVWPGTFILANFMEKHVDRYNTSLLELGSATAALTIYLRLIGFNHIITRLDL